MVISISSLALVGLLQDMILAQGLLLNVAHIILSWIFLVLFSDFKVCGLRSIPRPPMTALTEFFHADAQKNINLLPVF